MRKYVFDQAKKKVMKLTNGLYPAPLKIMEVHEKNISDVAVIETISTAGYQNWIREGVQLKGMRQRPRYSVL